MNSLLLHSAPILFRGPVCGLKTSLVLGRDHGFVCLFVRLVLRVSRLLVSLHGGRSKFGPFRALWRQTRRLVHKMPVAPRRLRRFRFFGLPFQPDFHRSSRSPISGAVADAVVVVVIADAMVVISVAVVVLLVLLIPLRRLSPTCRCCPSICSKNAFGGGVDICT